MLEHEQPTADGGNRHAGLGYQSKFGSPFAGLLDRRLSAGEETNPPRLATLRPYRVRRPSLGTKRCRRRRSPGRVREIRHSSLPRTAMRARMLGRSGGLARL